MTVVLRNYHPSLNEIREKMLDRVMLPKKVVNGLVDKCAEVAESIMMDAVLNTSKKIVTIEVVKSQPRLVLDYYSNRSGRYSCKCGNRRIYDTHKFCHNCGIEIEWVNR